MLAWWDTRRDAEVFQSRAKAVTVVAAIGDQFARWRQRIDQQARAFVVVHLAFREQQNEWPAGGVAHRVELGIQASFGASDAPGPPFFCSRLAAVRWALRCVESIMIRSGHPAAPAREANILSKTPSLAQRT